MKHLLTVLLCMFISSTLRADVFDFVAKQHTKISNNWLRGSVIHAGAAGLCATLSIAYHLKFFKKYSLFDGGLALLFGTMMGVANILPTTVCTSWHTHKILHTVAALVPTLICFIAGFKPDKKIDFTQENWSDLPKIDIPTSERLASGVKFAFTLGLLPTVCALLATNYLVQ
jgi:hypothetical protein